MLKISYVLTLVKKEHSILVIPVPKHGMIRFIQEHCNKFGRDHFIIVTDTGKTVMLLLVYLLWAEFDEPLDYQYKVK